MRRLRASTNILTMRIAILTLAIVTLLLVIISPLALRWFARVPGINWASLSNIGQTYGAISALLSALALGGVAISLLYQARDLKTSREQTSRAIHQELMRMEIEDPFYMEILAAPWGRTAGLNDYDALRRNNFVHLWVSYWEGQYVLGEMPESAVRLAASSELLVSPFGRRYWSLGRAGKLKSNTGRRLQFIKIIDEEYRKIVAEQLPATQVDEQKPDVEAKITSQTISRTITGVSICVVAGGAVLGHRLLSRCLSRKS